MNQINPTTLAAALAHVLAQQTVAEATPPAQSADHLAKVAEAEKLRKSRIKDAAKRVMDTLYCPDAPPEISAVYVQNGARDLAWQYHQKRNRIEYLTLRVQKLRDAGRGDEDDDVRRDEDEISRRYEEQQWIEVYIFAAEMALDDLNRDIERLYGENDYRKPFMFKADLTEAGYAAWLDRDAANRRKRSQERAAAALVANNTLASTTLAGSIDSFLNQAQ